MIARIVAVLIAAFFVLPADAKSTPIIKAGHAALGGHLTDASGVSLYLFEEDRREGNQPGSIPSHCVNDCLTLWPPVPGDPLPAAGSGVDRRLIGSFRRPDGKVQATYNGWPLYYFAEDFIVGDTNGHQFEEFGGDWYLVTPTGREFGGKLASGGDYQGGEDCVCHETAAPDLSTAFRGTVVPPWEGDAAVSGVPVKTSLAMRFADAFVRP
jgi:predicted lipoprotein with Yx(FWY)xxD motif